MSSDKDWEGVCEAFGRIVGEDARRGIRCDDAESAYPLELSFAGTTPTRENVELCLLRSDGRRIQIWPSVGMVR